MQTDTLDAVRDIAARCESLGRNCEFGIVQRNLGLEPISLLRWGGADSDQALIDGLRNEFAGLGDEMTGAEVGHHWWLRCRRYQIEFHTDEPTAVPIEKAAERVRKRLRWLAAKLIDDVRSGERIFVYSSALFSDPLDGLGIADAFRSAGGCGPLLIVTQGDDPLTQIDVATFGATVPRLTPRGQAATLDEPAWHHVLQELAFAAARRV
jgi:hypothetical protein